MALPINIEELLSAQKIESNRIEFKKGWNPSEIYHTICAFANDLDNLGGGYIIVGVEQDDNGLAIRPVKGIDLSMLDKIQKDMIGYNNKITPFYMPRTSVEVVDGQNVLVIWVPDGINRPYSVRVDVTSDKNSKEAFYVRCSTSSVVAKGEVLTQLRDLASRIPFDGRGNPDITEDDIDLVLIHDYLKRAKSRMVTDLGRMSTMDILDNMDLLVGPSERRMIKNVAAMMFSDHPEKFFPYTQISVVVFPDGLEQNPNRFSEKTFKGSVPTIIRGALQYIKDSVIVEYVSKPKDRAESDRWFNFPYQAVEEAVVNAMYHRDYQEQQEVEIAVEPDEIRILSLSGPDRSISDADIKACKRLHSRRYRNSRLGDFFKELDLTEGRSTGIPTIQEELAKNGSPRAYIDTDADRSFFLIHIPVHPRSLEATQKTQKVLDDIALAKGGIESGIEGGIEGVKGVDTKGGIESYEGGIEIVSNRDQILVAMAQNPNITITELSQYIGINRNAIQKHIEALKRLNKIKRIGSTKSGYWMVIK